MTALEAGAADVIYEAIIDSGLLAGDEQHWHDTTDLILDRLIEAGWMIVSIPRDVEGMEVEMSWRYKPLNETTFHEEPFG